MVEVVASDRPGLLFALADALFRLGLSVAVAKIATEGTRVTDVFYVADARGAKVPAIRGAELERALSTAIEALGG